MNKSPAYQHYPDKWMVDTRRLSWKAKTSVDATKAGGVRWTAADKSPAGRSQETKASQGEPP